jgi:hypothetical protein
MNKLGELRLMKIWRRFFPSTLVRDLFESLWRVYASGAMQSRERVGPAPWKAVDLLLRPTNPSK